MMLPAKLLLVLGLSCLVSACATKPIEVISQPIDKPNLILPQPTPVDMREIKWLIVTPENAEAVFAKLREQGSNSALFALTDDGYQALSLNFADIKRFVDQNNGVVLGYKEYYVTTPQPVTPPVQ